MPPAGLGGRSPTSTNKCKIMHIGKNERAGESYFMLSKKGEKIHLQELTKEKELE